MLQRTTGLEVLLCTFSKKKPMQLTVCRFPLVGATKCPKSKGGHKYHPDNKELSSAQPLHQHFQWDSYPLFLLLYFLCMLLYCLLHRLPNTPCIQLGSSQLSLQFDLFFIKGIHLLSELCPQESVFPLQLLETEDNLSLMSRLLAASQTHLLHKMAIPRAAVPALQEIHQLFIILYTCPITRHTAG